MALERGIENAPMLALTSQTVPTPFQGYSRIRELVNGVMTMFLTIKNGK